MGCADPAHVRTSTAESDGPAALVFLVGHPVVQPGRRTAADERHHRRDHIADPGDGPTGEGVLAGDQRVGTSLASLLAPTRPMGIVDIAAEGHALAATNRTYLLIAAGGSASQGTAPASSWAPLLTNFGSTVEVFPLSSRETPGATGDLRTRWRARCARWISRCCW
jgi:hypothetical protein